MNLKTIYIFQGWGTFSLCLVNVLLFKALFNVWEAVKVVRTVCKALVNGSKNFLMLHKFIKCVESMLQGWMLLLRAFERWIWENKLVLEVLEVQKGF